MAKLLQGKVVQSAQMTLRVATNTVYVDAARASHVVLPVVAVSDLKRLPPLPA